MKSIIVQTLVPASEAYHLGGGEYSSFICGYYEVPVCINTSAFFRASIDEVTCRSSHDGPNTKHRVVCLETAQGPAHNLHRVTPAEFRRIAPSIGFKVSQKEIERFLHEGDLIMALSPGREQDIGGM